MSHRLVKIFQVTYLLKNFYAEYLKNSKMNNFFKKRPNFLKNGQKIYIDASTKNTYGYQIST